MRVDQIAAQLYTVREFLRTPAEIEASLKKVKEIGYPAVQLSGLGPIEEAELAMMLKDVGLVCCATHEASDWILDHPEAVVCHLQMLGCTHTAYPWPSVKLDTRAEVQAFAQRLNAAGRVLREAGITLSYHNHSVEFRRVEGKLILELIYEETDPRYLQGEPDTYWVQHGGGDPEDWCHKLQGRLPLLHLKDYGMGPEGPTFFEVGYGNLTWEPILAAAEASGCQWYIVEQDVCARDPFESLRMSFEYLRGKCCS